MENADGSKRVWTMDDVKQMFSKCGASKPDKASWGDVLYVFAMMYADYFPKVLESDKKLVKATLAYLDDPDAPEGVALVRYLSVSDFSGDKIEWGDFA